MGKANTNQEAQGARLYEQGLVLEAEGKTRQAVEAYQEAVRLAPRLAQAHFNLGVGFAMLGENDQAIRSWRKAIWLKSEFINDLIVAMDLDHELQESEADFVGPHH